jgi:phosphomannomutase/phosphoglucomutase
MSIFKACDVRGKFGADLTAEVAERLGRAVGTILTGQKVVVGGDLRPSTAALKEAVIAGLLATGCHVLDLGILPTPAFYFAKDLLAADGGVMVTGSHNPPGDNGFKLSLGPLPITEEELAEVERLMTAGNFATGRGSYECVEVVNRYVDAIRARFAGRGATAHENNSLGPVSLACLFGPTVPALGHAVARSETGQSRSAFPGQEPKVPFRDDLSSQPANFIRRLKVVVDAGNGCYSRIAPALLRELGYDVVELFCEPDGHFPGRNPNPAVAANLSALCETVIATRADLGAAYDGDGDRVVFVDERGRVVESDRAIVLFARYLLRHPNVITDDIDGQSEVVYDFKCSSVVPEGVRRAGGVPIMERSGHAFIKTTLLRRKAILGGEISGHFFFGELGGDDGLYAALLMLQIVAEDGRGLAAMVDSVPRYPITPDIRLPCLPAEAQAIVEELAHAFAGEPGCQVSRLDGVRIAWPDGWALARSSVTEPLLTLRFEAHTEARLAEIRASVIARSARLGELMKRKV